MNGEAGSTETVGNSGVAGNGGTSGTAGSGGTAGSSGNSRQRRKNRDLGDDLPIADTARTIEMWLHMEGAESWKAEHSIIEYGGAGHCDPDQRQLQANPHVRPADVVLEVQ